MASRRQYRNKKVVMVPLHEVKDFAKLLTHRLSTAEVKTATPSRAQGKIQVRIAWTDPDGNHGLGYLSMSTQDAEGLIRGYTGPTLANFVQDIFRIPKWSRAMSRDKHGTESNCGAFESALDDELNAVGFLNSDSRIHTIKNLALDAIRKCAKAGTHTKALRARRREEAKVHLDRAVQYALGHGLKDAEIREIIDLSFVKHTMES